MKCLCGQPMRQHVISLDDIWWICMICGREKKFEPEPAPTSKHEPTWAVSVVTSKKRMEHTMSTGKNTLSDLNDHLFSQMERLSKCKGADDIKVEVERTRAMSGLAKEMIENVKTALEAHRTVGGKETPKMLQIGE